ncbi:hypothetical protein F383_39109 [Gossypium arboreum]|uniref:Uncharacterized protein n=1 Tax=Gossypium arboreum TaxID=29729 RepID=A0A0B0MKP7_GOSAR|nr:hypothetical protein F383_39109 [Gossypium arboreum]
MSIYIIFSRIFGQGSIITFY